MPVAGLTISNSPIGFRDRVADSSEGAPASRTTAPLRSRRSVSSMKGLLPLTLSSSSPPPSPSSCSNFRSHLPLDEGMERREHDCLPEILARDLELSKAIFEARSMTAGAPIPIFTSDYTTTRPRTRVYTPRMSSSSSSSSSSPSPSPYQTALPRVQSLGAIQERSSMVSFLDQQEALKSDDTASDLDSLAGTEASSTYDAEPPSFRMREQSIVTNATSLASTNWRPSSKDSHPSPGGQRHEISWIDVDSDGEEDGNVDDANIASQLSPRPPTPPETDIDLDTKLHHGGLREAPIIGNILHRKSHSVSGGAPLASRQKQHSGRLMGDTWRPPSSQSNRETESITRSFSLHRAAVLARSQQSRRFPAQSIRTRGSSREDVDDIMSSMESQPSLFQPNAAYIRPSPPPSPLPSVQSWLNGSAQPYTLSFQSDELARVVPLPPDTIETLRVSTACFPETMLLTSSLTIETIRSYSKKVRHPSIDSTPISPPQSPASPGPKKSLWRRVVRRGSHSSGHRSRGSHSSIGSDLQPPSSSSLEAPKPWVSIKHVFGPCSDYICDALYAHIVAYNYISALVARNPPPSVHRAPTVMEPQHEDIPKKAASLLGLNSTPSVASSASSHAAKRRSSSLPPWAKEELMPCNQLPATSATQEAAMRSIQAELLGCIRRLMATARLMAENGTGDERMVDMAAEDADMLFMRSLCEIVRISEEAIYA